MEANALLWIGGIVVLSATSYVFISKGREEKKAKNVFLENKENFEDLFEPLLNNQLDVNEWTRRIITINDPHLINFWKKFVSDNRNSLASEWSKILSDWGVQLIVIKGSLDSKTAFLQNVDKFIPLLNTLINNSLDVVKWSECIVETNQRKLVNLWQKYIQKYKDISQLCSVWMKQLEAWGLRCDKCNTFTYIKNRYDSLYETENGSPMEENMRYQVITPCWILTLEDEEGVVSKKVVAKGKIKLLS